MHAQPSAVKNVAKSVFTLTTFKADGSILASSHGVFIDNNGTAMSDWASFDGAATAVVVDANGKRMEVESIDGASEIYDVVKFRVNGKTTGATVATTANAVGSPLYLVSYSVKKPEIRESTISKVEHFMEKYAYYIFDMEIPENTLSCAVVNANGQLLGILQSSKYSTDLHCTSANYVADMQSESLTGSDPIFRRTNIPVTLPDDKDQAVIALMLAGQTGDSLKYVKTIDHFIGKFPDLLDGYSARAHVKRNQGDFAAATSDMETAIKKVTEKDEAHFAYAQLIYQKELYQNSLPYDGWSLSRALEESQAAYRENPHPVYLQQQAQILFAQKQYETAYNLYMELSKSTLRSADIFYAAAQCKLEQEDKKTALAMLDSAVSTFTRPYVKTASPYLQQRARLAMDLRRFHQTIEDMKEVVTLEPTDALLWAEKGSYEVRLNLNEEAQKSAEECIRLDPQNGDGYLILGIALCGKGQKAEGLQNLEKAKELGNGQAQSMIEKFSK